MYFVYILQSQKDQSFYIGSTENLKKRVTEHNAQKTKSIASKTPYVLAWYSVFRNKEKALAFEKYLKSSSGFAFRNKRLV